SAAAFSEARNGIAGANYSLPTQSRRRPCEAEPRLPIPSAQVIVVEAAVAELLRPISTIGSVDSSRKETEVDLAVLCVIKRRVVFKSQPQVYCQRTCNAPIVLDIPGKDVASVLEQRWLDIAVSTASSGGISEPEICQGGTTQRVNREI